MWRLSALATLAWVMSAQATIVDARSFTATEFFHSFEVGCPDLDASALASRALGLGFVPHVGPVPPDGQVPTEAFRRGQGDRQEFLMRGMPPFGCMSFSQGPWASELLAASEAFIARQQLLANTVSGPLRVIYLPAASGVHAVAILIGFLDSQRAFMLLGRLALPELPPELR